VRQQLVRQQLVRQQLELEQLRRQLVPLLVQQPQLVLEQQLQEQ
jgi:hypothetical protein